MNKECRINSLAEYVEAVGKIELKKDTFSLPPKLLFRGHSNLCYKLEPSLGRRPSFESWDTWQSVELNLVERAQQKFPQIFTPSPYPALLLAKLQHYGICTRMLDLTDNALVALYFACLDSKTGANEDGEVIAFSAQSVVSVFNPFVNAIADTYYLTRNSMIDVENYLYRAVHQPYFSCYLPSDINNTKELLDRFSPQIQDPMFVEVGNVCERQMNQGGYFLLFPNKIKEYPADEGLSDSGPYLSGELAAFSKNNEAVVKSIIIPKGIKEKIRGQLCRFGITNEFLFADSVDEVCRCIMAEYRDYF